MTTEILAQELSADVRAMLRWAATIIEGIPVAEERERMRLLAKDGMLWGLKEEQAAIVSAALAVIAYYAADIDGIITGLSGPLEGADQVLLTAWKTLGVPQPEAIAERYSNIVLELIRPDEATVTDEAS
jgi:hypothetical protein